MPPQEKWNREPKEGKITCVIKYRLGGGGVAFPNSFALFSSCLAGIDIELGGEIFLTNILPFRWNAVDIFRSEMKSVGDVEALLLVDKKGFPVLKESTAKEKLDNMGELVSSGQAPKPTATLSVKYCAIS